MKRFLWLFIAVLALVLSACTQTTPAIETTSAQPPAISRFGASPTSGPAPLLVRFFWSISDANRDLMSCELDVSYDGNFTADYSVGLARTRASNCTSSSRINHTFGVGNHNVALRVCDGLSCTIREQTITVSPNPNNRPPVISNFAASPNPVGDNLPTTFSWTVSDPEGNPLTCTFDPDTATAGDEQAVPCNLTYDYTYTTSGNFTAQLSVTDGNSTTHRQTPVEVFTAFSRISAGFFASCALDSSNQAYCWGWNVYGQLGNGNTIDSNTPLAISMPAVTFSQVSSGNVYSCAIATTGNAYCWGHNFNGQLGTGNNTGANTPQAVSMPSGVSFSQISTSTNGKQTCALSPAGNAYCWGNNIFGQLGNGNEGAGADANTPQAVTMPTGITFSQVSTGTVHTCALATTGNAYCWGWNNSGELGNGPNPLSTTPQAVSMPSGVTFSQISTGASHTCALGSDSKAYCWGDNQYGQLGNSTGGIGISSNTPQAVSMPSGVTFSQIRGGGYQTCALATTGNAYCWGWNAFGQLGNGNTTDSNTPQAVSVPSGVTFSQVSTGASHTCALATTGQAYCWGANAYGGLGNSTTAASSPTPQAVVMP